MASDKAATFVFKGGDRYFNAAAKALEPSESRKAAGRKGGDWDSAVYDVRVQYAQLIGARESEITVFHNTTAAVQRILLVLNRFLRDSIGTLLLNDAEYPGIVAAAHDYWQGRLAVAAVARRLWAGDAQGAEERLWHAYLITRPSVVYVSHVPRGTGNVLDMKLLEDMREINPRVIIILDGAQAAGNVRVGPRELGLVDFYVTSGHKWLSGRTALGLVFARDVWDLMDQAQGYSSRSGSAGTGDLGVLRSAACTIADLNGGTTGSGGSNDAEERMSMIEAHNAGLARLFCRRVKALERRLTPIGWKEDADAPGWNRSGIVTIHDQAQLIDWGRLARKERIEFTLLRAEPYLERVEGVNTAPRFRLARTGADDDLRLHPLHLDRARAPIPAGTVVRFSFHYYHSEDDVDGLVEAICECRRSDP